MLAVATQQAPELLRLRSLLAATTQRAPELACCYNAASSEACPELVRLRSLLVATQQAPEAPGLACCCNTTSSEASLELLQLQSLLATKQAPELACWGFHCLQRRRPSFCFYSRKEEGLLLLLFCSRRPCSVFCNRRKRRKTLKP